MTARARRKSASADEAARAFAGSFKGAPAILEGFVDFAFEASVVAARGADGSFAAYDPPENLHENHILRRSIVPGRLTPAQSDAAKAIAKKIADALEYVGVLAVELFVGRDGALLVNEIAPRVHNSGHWTIEACACSQFEQHIRAVAGWPLGDPMRHADAVMENIIGAEADAWESLAKSGALHLYGKREARLGRKMGHVTRLKPKRLEDNCHCASFWPVAALRKDPGGYIRPVTRSFQPELSFSISRIFQARFQPLICFSRRRRHRTRHRQDDLGTRPDYPHHDRRESAGQSCCQGRVPEIPAYRRRWSPTDDSVPLQFAAPCICPKQSRTIL